MNQLAEVWSAFGSRMRPRLELPESRARALGFKPALLDVATMRVHRWPDGCDPVSDTVIAGFERDGFFYTRRAVTRACKEWGFGN